MSVDDDGGGGENGGCGFVQKFKTYDFADRLILIGKEKFSVPLSTATYSSSSLKYFRFCPSSPSSSSRRIKNDIIRVLSVYKQREGYEESLKVREEVFSTAATDDDDVNSLLHGIITPEERQKVIKPPVPSSPSSSFSVDTGGDGGGGGGGNDNNDNYVGIDCHGLIGLVRFLFGYYLVVITDCQCEAMGQEGWPIYSVKKVKMISCFRSSKKEEKTGKNRSSSLNSSAHLPSAAAAGEERRRVMSEYTIPSSSFSSNFEKRLGEEARYVSLFLSLFIIMPHSFFFSYASDITRTLQEHITKQSASHSLFSRPSSTAFSSSPPPPPPSSSFSSRLTPPHHPPPSSSSSRPSSSISRKGRGEGHSTSSSSSSYSASWKAKYVFNSFLLLPLLKCEGEDMRKTLACWALPILHGSVAQRLFWVNSTLFALTVVARRSRYYAGPRYYKRGVSALGHVANDVECEQMLWEIPLYNKIVEKSSTTITTTTVDTDTSTSSGCHSEVIGIGKQKEEEEYKEEEEEMERKDDVLMKKSRRQEVVMLTTNNDGGGGIEEEGRKKRRRKKKKKFKICEKTKLNDENNKNNTNMIAVGSIVMLRGSVPLYWANEDFISIKPVLQLHLDIDPFVTHTKLHFDRLFILYGSPIVVLNMVRQTPETHQEARLAEAFEDAISKVQTMYIGAETLKLNQPWRRIPTSTAVTYNEGNNNNNNMGKGEATAAISSATPPPPGQKKDEDEDVEYEEDVKKEEEEDENTSPRIRYLAFDWLSKEDHLGFETALRELFLWGSAIEDLIGFYCQRIATTTTTTPSSSSSVTTSPNSSSHTSSSCAHHVNTPHEDGEGEEEFSTDDDGEPGALPAAEFAADSSHLSDVPTTIPSSFSSRKNSSIHPQFQKGIPRINCVDCLDRTNLGMMAIAQESLYRQLNYLNCFTSNENTKIVSYSLPHLLPPPPPSSDDNNVLEAANYSLCVLPSPLKPNNNEVSNYPSSSFQISSTSTTTSPSAVYYCSVLNIASSSFGGCTTASSSTEAAVTFEESRFCPMSSYIPPLSSDEEDEAEANLELSLFPITQEEEEGGRRRSSTAAYLFGITTTHPSSTVNPEICQSASSYTYDRIIRRKSKNSDINILAPSYPPSSSVSSSSSPLSSCSSSSSIPSFSSSRQRSASSLSRFPSDLPFTCGCLSSPPPAISDEFSPINFSSSSLVTSPSSSSQTKAIMKSHLPSELLRLVAELWGFIGDELSLQYGGSAALHAAEVQSDDTCNIRQWKAIKRSNVIIAIKRYFNNVFNDLDKQRSLDLFLGEFRPSENERSIWEVEMFPTKQSLLKSIMHCDDTSQEVYSSLFPYNNNLCVRRRLPSPQKRMNMVT